MMQNLEVVLVHGLWHQPAHFDRLADDLRGQGVLVHVPRLHRGSLAADTAAVQETVDGCRTAPVVVGHSYGGSVITGLERVGHLFYVAAFVPASAESGALLGGAGALVNDAVQRNDDGTSSIRRNAPETFCTPIALRPRATGPRRCSYRSSPVTGVECPPGPPGKASRVRISSASRTGRSVPTCRNAWPAGAPARSAFLRVILPSSAGPGSSPT